MDFEIRSYFNYRQRQRTRIYKNNLLREILDLMQIKHRTVMPYAPQGNSTAERMHRSMAEYLRTYTNTSGDNWESFLPDLEFSLNVKVHSSTGHSPWYLTFGEYPHYPWRTDPTPMYSETESANRFRQIRYALELVKTTNEAAKHASKRTYDKKARNHQFEVGDSVLLHVANPPQGTNPKYWQPWQGVYNILEKLGASYFRISKPGGRSRKAHAQHLKHFNEIVHTSDLSVRLDRGEDSALESDEVTES